MPPKLLDTDQFNVFALASSIQQCISGDLFEKRLFQENCFNKVYGLAEKLRHLACSEEDIKEIFNPPECNFYYHYLSILISKVLYDEEWVQLSKASKQDQLFMDIVKRFSNMRSVKLEKCPSLTDPYIAEDYLDDLVKNPVADKRSTRSRF